MFLEQILRILIFIDEARLNAVRLDVHSSTPDSIGRLWSYVFHTHLGKYVYLELDMTKKALIPSFQATITGQVNYDHGRYTAPEF